MQENCLIKKLSLVNLQWTDQTFESLLSFVGGSLFLEDLCLSWCEVRHSLYAKLAECLANNR